MALSNNLTVSIGADSSKMRADLALAQARLKEFGREVRLAAEEARKTGDTRHLQAAAARYEALTDRVRGLKRELSQTGQATVGLGRRFDNLTSGIAGASAAFATLRGGLGAAGVAGAFYAVGRAIAGVTQSLTEIRNVSAASGFKPTDVKVFQEAMEGASVSTDRARQALTRFADQAADARQKAGTLGEDTSRGVNVLKGAIGDAANEVKVFRGGVKAAAPDISKPFETLNISVARFKNNADLLVEFAKRLAQVKDEQLRTALGVQVFGRQYSQMAVVLERLAESGAWDKLRKQLEDSGRAPTPEALERLKQYEAAWDEFGDTVESIIQPLVITWLPAMAQFIKNIAEFTKVQHAELTALWAGITQYVRDAATAIKDEWASVSASFTQTFNDIVGAAERAFNWVIDKARAAAAAVRSILPGSGGTSAPVAEAPIPGRAAGGYIRGPGSGTSDSILARLSNGEFVMRASAVQHWGAGLLSAMNAAGRPRFAAGGMVSAKTSDGATVNLMFPSGSSFALRGDAGIVAGLVREGRRAGMLNAGRVPGAFAA